MRACSRCREVKPFEEFHRAKSQPDGRHRQCKVCRSERGREAALAENGKRRERQELLAAGRQRCVTCLEVKGLDEFYKCSRNKSGRKGQCIGCYNSAGAEYRSRPGAREKRQKRRRDRKAAAPEEYQERGRNSSLRSKYGIGLREYNSMLARQCGLCAICGGCPGEGALLYVDHCHDSGRVRQLLCHSCNAGLGFFRDNQRLLAEAQRYLRIHS